MATMYFDSSYFSDGIDITKGNLGTESWNGSSKVISENSTYVRMYLTKTSEPTMYLDLTMSKPEQSIIKYIVYESNIPVFGYTGGQNAGFTRAEYSAYVAKNDFAGLFGAFLNQSDTIYGTTHRDILNGYSGNDSIRGGSGNDVIYGGDGLDTAYFDAPRASYSIGSRIVSKKDGSQTVVTDTERLKFSDTAIAFDITGSAGQSYRLYKAALDRTPDKQGLGYWINARDNGTSLRDIADSFIQSQEFKNKYGANPTNEQFVTLLYNNVLDRAPDGGGLGYWLGELSSSKLDKAGVLASFSESQENQNNVIGLIGSGIEYLMWG